MALLFRSEPFGAILAKSDAEEVLLLDHKGADAFLAAYKGLNGCEDSSSQEMVGLFRRIISEDASLSDYRVPEVPDSFPTLSYPMDLYWEITRRCNERCVHCYNNSGTDGLNPSPEKIDRILSELSSTQLRLITITGGEPMMRRDFWSISERARKIAYRLMLGTNATLINKSNVGRLCDLYDFVNISLDSPNLDDFDVFRQYRGAFERTAAALRLLVSSGMRVVVQSVLTRDSYEDLESLGDLLSDIGIETWSVRFPFRSGRAADNRADYFTQQEIVDRADKLEAMREKFANRIPHVLMGASYLWSYKEPYKPVTNPNRLVTCAAATVTAALSADGTLAPCSLFTETKFRSQSVWESSLKHEWQNSDCFNALRNLHLEDISGCGTCSNAVGRCGTGCRAKAYMKHGTIYKADYDCNYSVPRLSPAG